LIEDDKVNLSDEEVIKHVIDMMPDIEFSIDTASHADPETVLCQEHTRDLVVAHFDLVRIFISEATNIRRRSWQPWCFSFSLWLMQLLTALSFSASKMANINQV
jgi:hypothetical protein